jgi:hypothetical protein
VSALPDTEVNANGGKQSRLAERSDLVPPAAFLAVARVLRGGSEKYGDRNWRLIGVSEHLNHALTHAFKYLGDPYGRNGQEEDHLAHAACRLLMALEIDRVGMDDPEPIDLATAVRVYEPEPDGRIRTYSDGSTGWNPGEGVSLVRCDHCDVHRSCRVVKVPGEPTCWACGECYRIIRAGAPETIAV